MQAVVVYESMFGNTHKVAAAIGRGLSERHDTAVVAVHNAAPELVARAGLLVVGGPTHLHGMSRPRSRDAAVKAAQEDPDLTLDPDARDADLRAWLSSVPAGAPLAAAFDTRLPFPMAGRAGRRIAHELRHHGATLLVAPESFCVDKSHSLLPGEEARAVDWGRRLGAAAAERLGGGATLKAG